MSLMKQDNKKTIKKKKISNSTVSTVLLTSAAWALGVAGLGYVNQYTNIKTISFEFAKKNAVVYVANKDMDRGVIIKDSDIEQKQMDVNYITKGSIKNPKQLIGKQVTNKLYKNEQITPADIIEPKIVKDNLITYSIPINLSLLHDNNIKINDYVDVVIDYKEKLTKERPGKNGKTEKYAVNKPSEIVAGKVVVTQIIDAKGNKITKPELQTAEEKQQPAFVSVLVKKDLLNNLNDAKKRGKLTLVKYLDASKEKEKENYKPSWLD